MMSTMKLLKYFGPEAINELFLPVSQITVYWRKISPPQVLRQKLKRFNFGFERQKSEKKEMIHVSEWQEFCTQDWILFGKSDQIKKCIERN